MIFLLCAICVEASANAAVPRGVAILSHNDLVADGAIAQAAIRLAFGSDSSYGLIMIRGIPGFAEARRAAFNATIRLARDEQSPVHSRRPRSTWPGLRHPAEVDDPLQGGFLHNMLEEVGPARVDPVFGKNPWPDDDFKSRVVAVNQLIHNVTLAVLRLERIAALCVGVYI